MLVVGVAASIVYVMVRTDDFVLPDLYAMAFTVVVLLTVKAPVYTVDEVVGVDPLVVYRMVAPDVAHEMETVNCETYDPAAGLMIGVETVAA